MSSAKPRFEVRLRSRRVVRELDSLQRADRRRVLAVLHGLADDPRPPGCEKLYGDVYRVRVGNWRVIYLVDEPNSRVDVGAIRRPSERTYRRVDDLFR